MAPEADDLAASHPCHSHGKYSEPVNEERSVDPMRRELVERWNSYLIAEQAGPALFDWLDAAFAGYRDEIVHIGLQSFNDNLEIEPTKSDLQMSRSAYATWLRECDRFDSNPSAWERDYWSRYVHELRATQPGLASRVERQLREAGSRGRPAQMSLESRASNPLSREDLVSFLGDLADSIVEAPDGWENPDLESFLRAWAAWLEDMDQFFLNRAEPVPSSPSWQLIAQMLLAARVYE